MEGPEGITLSEINQKEKEKYHVILLSCGILKNKTKQKQMNKQSKTQTEFPGTEDRSVVTTEKWIFGSGVGEMGKGN